MDMTMTDSAATDSAATANELQEGRVVSIAGPVIDAEFPRGALPEINTALEFDVHLEGETITVLAEVAQQLGNGRVRAICMKPTDGLVRGAAVRNTGHGIQVPVGDKVLGNVWNVWGEALDTQPEGLDELERWDIHRPAPAFADLAPKKVMFETGIKVIDLLTHTSRAARSACSVAPAWARPCSSPR